MFDIASQRFYGAKSEPVDAIDVAATCPVEGAQWQLLDVTHGGVTDTYQVLLGGADFDTDVLHTDAGATAYLAALPQLGEVHGELRTGPATALGAEQSNTSLVVGDTIVKVFRRLEDRLNPDVELLSRIGSCPNVAAVNAYVTRGEQTLAMQQELVRGGVDGFDLATGGGLDADATRALGEAMRTVHDALTEEFGVEHVEAAEIAQRLAANLEDYVRRAPVLADVAPRIRDLYAALDAPSVTPVQRVHGDLHLGQTLKTPERWYLIDFEGEPARPLAQRRRPDHRLRDVAGMVRSLGYARAVGGFDADWEQARTAELLDGYGVARDALLAAYIVDKAAYEVVYEANNRPDWVDIPLTAIRQLV
ncbi:trehalose synthase [Corynebacterium sp. HMSC074A01]|uniref:trehalose synthase n=1 Tax=Corynebacterium sp. HMSC074A01 TaxID=1715030 RepID=UPI0008A59FC0|nr:trehalose synthase [Corynebacterium sp. HMSC074A01]OHF36819.1 trehalose synthase [Corynebacterium sp. HMSC074A01]